MVNKKNSKERSREIWLKINVTSQKQLSKDLYKAYYIVPLL